MPIANEGTPSNWTLRFKSGKITILLYAEPLSTITVLKTELLSTLRERYPKGLPNSEGTGEHIPIPESLQELYLAVLVDEYDHSKGWADLITTGVGGLRESVKNLGLKDGGCVAFTFGPAEEEEDGSDEIIAREFTVQWPTYEDAYPDQVEEEP